MLKWLRKYNSIILVIGGALLMIAFLLPQTIEQLGKTPLGGTPMKIDGKKISYSAYQKAHAEHYAVSSLFGRGVGGENTDHWILLTREADKAGYVGGKHDGQEFLPQIARDMTRQMFGQMADFMPPEQIDNQAKQLTDAWIQRGIPDVMGTARLSEDDVYRAIGKLHAIMRMRMAYGNAAAARFSEPRLVSGLKGLADAASIDAVFVPAERELANVTMPDDAALRAHFEKFKSIKPTEGEFGIGYLLPERVKLAWMTLDTGAVQAAITPDEVEVRKRFLRLYPTGVPPAGETAEAASVRIENDVRAEQVERVLKSADQGMKIELERAMRKLELDGDFKKLPANWAEVRPDFAKLRDSISAHVLKDTGVTMPAPAVTIKDATWLTRDDVRKLTDIGSAVIRRGDRSEPFDAVVFSVRELAGTNDLALQVGVPALDFAIDPSSRRHYFMVLDARKESSPESMTEIEATVLADVKRLAAFEKLKAQEGAFRLLAETPDGLSAIAKAGAATPADELVVKKGLRVEEARIGPTDPSLDHEAFRSAVLSAAAKIDPLADINTVDMAQRSVVAVIPKSLGIGVARINTVAPLTVEQFRMRQSRGGIELIRKADLPFLKEDPFSLTRMEERLNVEYKDGRDKKKPQQVKAETGG